jgi:transcriptional regulator with XRE-family HTH domain
LKYIPKAQIKKLLGQAIRKHRERLDMTQEELAEKAELHRTHLADIERGTRNPSLESLRRIALGLGISISELFKTAEGNQTSTTNS